MANEREPDVPVSVTTGEVRVGKAFEADRFPVPAIAFEIESLADEPIRIRLVDDVPESFPMEGVGFHPDYEGDNWTAYRDNRVAYERTLDPGESVLTVYGIRIDDSDEADDFLDEPTVELVDHGDAAVTGDVLGRETTQVVRDALSGDDADDLSGLDPDPLLGDETDDETPAPRERRPNPTRVTGDRDESVTAVEPGSEDDTAPSADGETTRVAAPGSVAAALAAEIRDGTADDEDLAVVREAFESAETAAVPTSVDVRIGRLQSRIEDLLAYRDALADFLDENGTAEEVVGEVSEELRDLSERVESLRAAIEDADAERAELEAAVETIDGRLDGVADDVADLSATVETVEERLDAVEGIRSDVEEIEAELAELRSFRDRLSSAFGTDG
jgi:prefoldin subunit 5